MFIGVRAGTALECLANSLHHVRRLGVDECGCTCKAAECTVPKRLAAGSPVLERVSDDRYVAELRSAEQVHQCRILRVLKQRRARRKTLRRASADVLNRFEHETLKAISVRKIPPSDCKAPSGSQHPATLTKGNGGVGKMADPEGAYNGVER